MRKYFQYNLPKRRLKPIVRKIEKDIKLQFWQLKLNSEASFSGNKGGNKLRTYKSFEQNFGFQNYLSCANMNKYQLFQYTSLHWSTEITTIQLAKQFRRIIM